MKKLELPMNIFDAIHHERIEWTKKVDELVKIKEPYVEIFKLLDYWQHKTDKGGLEQKHFRYALVNRKKETLDYTKGMEKFFGDSLDTGIFRRDCIPSRKHLNFYLKRLYQLGIIDRLGRRKPYRYKLSDKHSAYSIRDAVKFHVDRWDDDMVLNSDTTLQLLNSSSRDPYYYWYLFGLDKKFFDNLDSRERVAMREHLRNIEKAVTGILDIKFKIAKPEMTLDEYFKWSNTINTEKDSYGPGKIFREEDMKSGINIFIQAGRSIISK